jgi:hypothetical protein
VHCMTTTTTLVGASSLQHFLKILHSISFVENLVFGSFICLTLIPLDTVLVPYLFFISSVKDFSLVLSSMYFFGFSPSVDNPMIYTIKSTSMNTVLVDIMVVAGGIYLHV